MNDATTALRKLADDNLTDGNATWADDPDMLSMVASDSADFRAVADLLEAGKDDEAEAYLSRMDTSPRERAYEAIESVNKPFDGEPVVVIKKSDLARIRELAEANGLLEQFQALGIMVHPLELH